MKRKIIFSWTTCFFIALGVAQASESFLNLEAFSAARGFYYHWDPLTQLASVSNKVQTVKFRVGSEFGLSEDRLIHLGAKTCLRNGAVEVPFPAKEYLDRLGYFLPEVTPSAPTVTTSVPAYHRIRRVILDAGHGGMDSGAISPYGLKEKHVVLEIAKKVKKALEAQGLEVVMTRNSDIFIPLAERAEIANKQSADFFVSIHANASLTRSLQGFEIYYLSEATDDAALALERAENSALRFEVVHPLSSKGLKTIYWDLRESENRKESLRMAGQIMNSVTGSVKVSAARVRSANFYVLKWTECPAILIEMGYLTNKQDERKLRNPVYKQHLASAIVEGIGRYKMEYEATNGFTQ